MKITNRDARKFVQQKHPFQGNNLFGQLFCVDPKDDTPGQYGYVVYSYGYHHPLLICVHVEGQDMWVANEDGYSPSTKRHMSQCRPDTYSQGSVTLNWLSTAWMLRIVRGGYRSIAQQRVVQGVTL